MKSYVFRVRSHVPGEVLCTVCALCEVSCVPSDLLRVPGEVLRVPGKVLHDPGEALHVLGEVSCVLGEVLCDRDEVLRVQVRTYMFSPHPLLNLFYISNLILCDLVKVKPSCISLLVHLFNNIFVVPLQYTLFLC